MEIGSAALNILVECWDGHLTPPEVASLADRASRARDPNMVRAAAELALSCLPHAHALNPNEIQRALVQCKEQVASAPFVLESVQVYRLQQLAPLIISCVFVHNRAGVANCASTPRNSQVTQTFEGSVPGRAHHWLARGRHFHFVCVYARKRVIML